VTHLEERQLSVWIWFPSASIPAILPTSKQKMKNKTHTHTRLYNVKEQV